MNKNELYQHMLDATLTAVSDEAPQLLEPLKKALDDLKASIQHVEQAYMNSEITALDAHKEFKRARKVLEAELVPLEICAEATIQKVIQKVIDAAMSSLTSANGS
ncbi:hypothetical protein [Pseudoalteromonas ardens]|uniref:Uncharacterized protein n=1 Tax=Pseudoalteromonas rubra TaxID=43658 RepID=A0A0L0ETQ6_9GAMM|nr:hypothetical protein [Pseudoalteromonas sp. R96]KNC67760.1 hypothetical protein AC626_08720 [Pseudoalteromonas rubra]MDK1312853.1 hypothetical protein [Pseudoalteromonas sp. R96]